MSNHDFRSRIGSLIDELAAEMHLNNRLLEEFSTTDDLEVLDFDDGIEQKPVEKEDFVYPNMHTVGVDVANLFLSPTGKDNEGNTLRFIDSFKNINIRDALSINLQSRQTELMETEAKWKPETLQALLYLELKKQLLTALSDPETDVNSLDIKELLELVKLIEPYVRETALTNPYIQDVFYKKLDVSPINVRGLSRGIATNDRTSNTILHWKTDRTGDDLATIQNLIDSLTPKLEELDDEFNEKATNIQSKYNSLKTAHWLHDPIFNLPLPIKYDPNKIDKNLDEARGNTEISFLDPNSWKYGLLHLGSSYSEIQAMSALMAASCVLKWGTGLALGASSGGTVPFLLATAESAMGLAATNYFRNKETAAEVMSNYSERVLDAMNNGSIDTNNILDLYDEKLRLMGYDTSNMDDLSKLQMGLAHNIPTDDAVYNQLTEDSKKGLSTLKDANNALALSDYLLNFGLMYGGKYIKNAFGFNKATKSLSGKIDNLGLGIIKNKIGRATDKLISNPGTRLKAKHITDKGVLLAKTLGKLWFFERTEEGIQGMVGRRYKAGEYDNRKNLSSIDGFLRGVVDDGLLGTEANLAYYGLHWDDKYNTDEQLKREMEIGGFIGMFMGNVHAVGDVRLLKKQLRADEVVRSLAAEGYDKAETSFKVKQFLSMYRDNKNPEYIYRSLEEMKQFKPEGVTDEMIDDDKTLAADVNSMYVNKAINSNLKSLKIKRSSDSFDKFVQSAIDVDRRYKAAHQSTLDSTKAIDEYLDGIVSNDEDNLLNTTLRRSLEASQQLLKDMSFEEFKRLIVNGLSFRTGKRALTRLYEDLDIRLKDLESIKQETGLDVDTRGVENIKRYVKGRLDFINSKYDEVNESFYGLIENFPQFVDESQLEKLITASTINQAVETGLEARRNAYVTGRLPVEYMYMTRRITNFDDLTEDQQKEVIDSYPDGVNLGIIKSAFLASREKELDTIANGVVSEDAERAYANEMFLEDLTRTDREEKISRRELEEQFETQAANEPSSEQIAVEEQTQPTPQVDEQPVEETVIAEEEVPVIEEKPVTERPTAPLPSPIDSATAETTSPMDGVDEEVDDVIGEALDGDYTSGVDKIEVIDETETQSVDQENDNYTEPILVDDEERAANERVEDDGLDAVRPTYERVENGEPMVSIEDGIETSSQEEPPAQVDETKEPEVVDNQTVEEDKEIKPTELTGAKTAVLNIESLDGLDERTVEIEISESGAAYSDGNRVWVGNENPEFGLEIGDATMEALLHFEEYDSLDMSFVPTVRKELSQTDKSPGLDTKEKVERNRIHSTFFYDNSATEIMPITTSGKQVKFNGERRPGAELAKKLAIPGWLRDTKIYYIVTDSKNAHKDTDLLAVHMIIEKVEDGKTLIYNTALRDVPKAVSILNGYSTLSQKDVQSEIALLRALRNSIIKLFTDKYAPDYFSNPKAQLPTVAMDGVVPSEVRISNGTINSQSEQETPVFRSLTDVDEFDLSSDPYEMSRLIETGEAEFGYGVGPFTLQKPYTIMKLDGSNPTSAQGTGYAGKIYYVPKIKNTPSQRLSVPIMLSEGRHYLNTQMEDFQTSYTPDGKAKYDDNGKRIPLTTAEVIFRFITSSVVLNNPKLTEDVLNILVNHGSRTLTVGDDLVQNISFFVRKVLHTYRDENGLQMLIYAVRMTEGTYKLRYLKIRDKDGKIAFNDELARSAIKNIANNLHWNTDKEAMTSPIPDSIVREAINYMTKYNTNYYRVLNCDDLTFTMDDLGLTRSDKGLIVRKLDTAPLLLTWLINHEFLKTDVGQHAFDAPFVYSGGVRTVETGAEKAQATVPKNTVVQQEETALEQKSPEVPEQLTSEDEKLPTKPSNNDVALSYDEAVARGLTPKRGYTYVLKSDGTTVLLPDSSKVLNRIKGVHSVVRGEGKVNQELAKKWLHEALGIDIDNVFTTSAIMKMADAPQVYGVMKVVYDRLLKEFRPQIVLSDQAGAGIEYHEGFHYISLLVLNENLRIQVYADYVKQHPEYEGLTRLEIEELLAEEFRSYMLKEKNPSLGYRITKFFKSIWDLIRRLGGREINLYNQLFNDIRNNRFSNAKLSQNDLKEFEKAYSSGVYYYAPGITSEEQKATPHITNASTMYSIIDSLSSTSLAILNIRSMDDINNIKLREVFDTILYMYDAGEYDDNLSKKLIVEDVLANKAIFAKLVRNYLRDLGIRSIEQEEKEIAEKEAKDTGEAADNIWDRNSYEISKKANVAFNAKLFFYSIPESKYAYDENGVRYLDSVRDNIFGMEKTMPFSVTWNRILENLWDSNDWLDLLDKCRRQAKADAFFARLLEVIDNPQYPLSENTITLILTTVQSTKNSMDTIKVDADKVWRVEDSDSLRKIAKYPSLWSLNFMLSGMIKIDSKDRLIIDPKALQVVNKLAKSIQDNINKSVKNRSEDRKVVADRFETMKDEFLQILNSIGIPFDVPALDYLLNSINPARKIRPDIPGFDAFNIIFSDNGNTVSNTIYNGVLDSIKRMSSNKSLEVSSRKAGTISADRIFNSNDPKSVINLMAVAYGKTHPTPEEFSVTGADGSLVYPISENNYMSDLIRWLNTNRNNKLDNLKSAAYSANSLIVKALSGEDRPLLKLHTMIAMEDAQSGTSRDYFGISPLEDYINKLLLAHKSRLILPTMSDKKTWYSIEGIDLVKEFLSSMYTDNDPDGKVITISKPRGFLPMTIGNTTILNTFYDYLLDEYNAVREYYNNKHLVEQGKSRYYDNYHGKIGKNGKMKPGGNGGRFRYFNLLKVNGKYFSLNELLDIAERTGDDRLVNEVLDNYRKLFIENPDISLILNDTLMDSVNEEIEKAIKLGVIGRNEDGLLVNVNLPKNVIEDYKQMASYIKYESDEQLDDDVIFSIIANYATSYAISIEELEKCFTGDPAMYKWKTAAGISEMYDPESGGYIVSPVTLIVARDVDKIKRLSSVLSTGTNLRTNWGPGDPRNNTKFVSVVMKDNEMGSEWYNDLYLIFRSSFIRTMLKKQNPELTDQLLLDATSTEENTNKSYDSLSEEAKKFVDKQAKNAADPYAYDDKGSGGNINQANAAMYIRPAMYKRIMQALGQWSAEIEEAYNILESDPDENGKSFLNDPELYAKALKASIKPLKMMYFGDHYDSLLNLNVPVFDKMAIFPMFKVLAKADNKYLYLRMNDESLGVIDMITFESAVKVGAPADKFKAYKDNRNTVFNKEDLFKPSTNILDSEGNPTERLNDGITTRILDISQLRLQLNTDPHEHEDRSFGTQAVKIGMGNVIDTRIYGKNKGLSVSGSLIKTDIFECIKALSSKGHSDLLKRFFKKDGVTINKAKLSTWLIEQALNTNMSSEILEALKLDNLGNFTAPIASLSVRNWIESKIISLINKDIIDVNTPGGSAIQMSSFGFKANDVLDEESAKPFNDGKTLSFEPRKGSMEVMLSTNFFRSVVPKDVQQLGFKAMRDWLIDNNIIGNNASPYGIGYRIPTQGLSSTFSFVVADVLPALCGDVIVVPDEFTAMTGSDFDVDKLYIATYAYDKETHTKALWKEGLDYSKQGKNALINKLIDSYTLVISDETTLSETRASIDTLTNILLNEVLPLIQSKSKLEAKPFYELMPSFLESRKEEYTGGKAGIAPFALNSTNHCLTQAVHLHMRYSNNNVYGLGELDAIDGQDGFKILDWLSAMINAHVDVAKDPYIMTLNVNKVTYNITNLLLRGGKGKSTFYFLALPVLKQVAARKIANEGIIGVTKLFDNQIYKKIEQEYSDMLSDLYPEEAAKFENDANDDKLVFDDDLLIKSLSNFTKGKPSAQDIKQLLRVLKAYKRLSTDALVLSDLVQRSLIDTKKYGNNLTQLQNFYNSYTTFIEDNRTKFSTPANESDGLADYFNLTFLSKKLGYAMSLSNNLLRSQVLSATNGYKTMFTEIMHHVRGGNYSAIYEKNNTLLRLQLYRATSNKKLIKKINDRLESIVRARAAYGNSSISLGDQELNEMLFGESNIASELNKVKEYIRTNRNDANLITLVNEDGSFKNELLNYLLSIAPKEGSKARRIVTATSSMNNDRHYDDRLTSAFFDLLTNDDPYVRSFAEKLVKYAFVTSYDNRTPNSFFNIVPLQYKEETGYIQAIKDALFSLSRYNMDDMAAALGFDDLDSYSNSLYTSLVRNYWLDNDIVRVFTPVIKKDYSTNSTTSLVTYLSNSKMQGSSWYKVPVNTAFITTNQYDINNNDNFLKILNKDALLSMLYQKVGVIVDNTNSSKTIGVVYRAVPKLGYQSGSNSVYELYKNGNEMSAFESNAFTEEMMQLTTTELADNIKDYISKLSNRRKLNDGDIEFIPSKSYEAIEAYTKSDTRSDENAISFEDVERELLNDLVEAFADMSLGSYEVESTNLESQEATLELVSYDIDQELSDLSDLSEEYGDPMLELMNDMGDIVIDPTNVIEDVMGSLQDPNDNVMLNNEELASLSDQGKKRRKQCKK